MILNMEKDLKKILDFAIGIARAAGQIQLEYFRSCKFDIDTKLNTYDVVTTADKESENLIISMIQRNYPTHGIISEEAGTKDGNLDYRWVIDPLDGTTNFSQGLPVFSVSIALEYNEETVIGVVYAPYLNELFYAIKGEGAFFNGKKIRCSTKTNLEEAVVSTGFPYDKRENPDNNIKEISKVAPRVRGLRRMGSAAVDMCYVAAGYFDAYWELNLKRWDVAAGSLIAMEAGANVFSLRENRNHSILVTTPGICNAMLEILLTPDIHAEFH